MAERRTRGRQRACADPAWKGRRPLPSRRYFIALLRVFAGSQFERTLPPFILLGLVSNGTHLAVGACAILLLPAPLADLLAQRFQRKKEMMRRIPARSAEAIISEGGATPLLHRHSCSIEYTPRASLHHRGGIPYANRSGLSISSALECNLAQRLVENRRDALGSGLRLWV